MDKSPDAFRTISEVAEDLDLPQHVLRFWETRFTQIKPMKRGGGRRYYRPQDVELIKGIRHLLYDQGYTIKGVQKILREQGIEQVKVLARGAQTPTRRTDSAKSAPTPARKSKGASAATAAPSHTPQIQPAASPNTSSSTTSSAGAGGPAASRAEVIRSVIRELEQCRALLIGNVMAEASAGAKRSRAGGRT